MLNLRIMSWAFFHFISFVMKERFQRKYSVKESLIVWTEIYHPYPWSDLVSENVQTNSSSDLNNIFPQNNTLTHTFHYKWALVQSLPSCTKSILSIDIVKLSLFCTLFSKVSADRCHCLFYCPYYFSGLVKYFHIIVHSPYQSGVLECKLQN